MQDDLVELDKGNYFSRLGRLLEHIAGTDFLSIDFELSGIPTKLSAPTNRTKEGITRQGKPTLQERYEEMKAAAEKYSILQIGITLATQSKQGDAYFLEPYNINLNPSIIHRMDVDRDVSMLSSSVQFLMQNGFNIEKPFSDGVPYLSRMEEQDAIQTELARLDGRAYQNDIILDEREVYLRDFVIKTREQIKNWKPSTNKKQDDCLFITGGTAPMQVALSRLQRGLVYQMVRKEFKNYVATASGDTIKILVHDKEREKKLWKTRIDGFMQRISKQSGFRWAMEAMVGGDLQYLDPYDLYMKPDTQWLNMNKVKADMASLRDELKAHRPVLVGHNMFMDLIFMYKAFYGPLPDKVTDFAKLIHELFPMIIDTKFLCTHSGNADNTSLEELTASLNVQDKPAIVTRPGHRRYEKAAAFHEAGYDSWQTAKLFIKTGAKLAGHANWRRGVTKPTYPGTARPLSPGLNSFPPASASTSSASSSSRNFDPKVPYSPGGLSLKDHAEQTRAFNAWKKKNPSTSRSTPFPSHLLSLDQYHLLPKWEETYDDANPYGLPDPATSKPDTPQWMPPWDHEFWLLFGNKIRINGTQEAMLDLLADKEKVVAA